MVYDNSNDQQLFLPNMKSYSTYEALPPRSHTSKYHKMVMLTSDVEICFFVENILNKYGSGIKQKVLHWYVSMINTNKHNNWINMIITIGSSTFSPAIQVHSIVVIEFFLP